MSDDPGSMLPVGIVCYLLCVIGCGYFAGTEISFALVNRIHIISRADKGDRRAKRVLAILEDFEAALSTLLIGNNIMNIGCATLSVLIARDLWGSSGVSVATVLTALILFVFGEMIPKCFARSCNERFALAVSGSLVALMKILKPLSWFFTLLSKTVTAPFVKRAEPEVTMTENELNDIVENISAENGIDEDKGNLMRSALHFSDRLTGDVMVPWEAVQTVSVGMKTPQILKTVQQSIHSRLPVLGRDGSVRGILQIRSFMRAFIKNKRVVLASVTDYPYYMKPDIPLDDALAQMSNHRRNLAIIKSETGEILGILTVEDILEELVGEIYDENDIGGEPDA